MVIIIYLNSIAGWSSLVARWAHNPKVVGSNPTPATNFQPKTQSYKGFLIFPTVFRLYDCGPVFFLHIKHHRPQL